MLRFPRKKSRKPPLAIGLATSLAMGGLIAVYLRWFRPGDGAAHDNPLPAGGTQNAPEATRLATHWHSLDAEPVAAHIPKSLER